MSFKIFFLQWEAWILHAQNFAQNPPPCAEFGVLRRIEENLPNGAENANILLIFVNPFTYNG